MNHSFFSGSEFDECAEFLNTYNGSLENLAFLEISGDDLNHLYRFIHHFLIGSAYGNLSVIGNINLNAGAGDNLIDCLSALSNHITNLLGIDLYGNNLRSKLTDLSSGSCNAGSHDFIHDILSCFLGLGNRFLYDRSGQAVNLNIHLDCGNTVMGTCHLKVHIAKEVFQSLDIGKHDIIIIGIAGYQTAGDTCNLLLNGNACSHQ